MTNNNNKKDFDINQCVSKSTFWLRKAQDLKIIEDCLHGGEWVKANGYLIQNNGESDDKYIERRKFSIFNPFLEEQLKAFNEKLFQMPISIKTEDTWLNEKQKNFDGYGRTFHEFAKDFQFTAEKFSEGYCFTDKTAATFDDFGNVINGSELNMYNIILCVDDILHTRTIDDKVSYIRFKEKDLIQRDWNDTFITVVKELFLDKGTVYYNKYQDKGDGVFVQTITRQDIGLKEIPLTDLYPSGYKDRFCVEPLWRSIAELNMAHYNYYSLYLNQSKTLSTPILYGKNMGLENTTIRTGSGKLLHSENADSDLKYVEPNGASLAGSLTTVNKIEGDVIHFGLNVNLLRNKANETATQSNIDETTINSVLSAHAYALKQALEKIVNKMLMWEGKEHVEFAININTDFNIKADSLQLQVLNDLYDRKVISKESFVELVMNAGFLPETFDFEKDKAIRLKEEEDEMPSMLSMLPGQGNFENVDVNKDVVVEEEETQA